MKTSAQLMDEIEGLPREMAQTESLIRSVMRRAEENGAAAAVLAEVRSAPERWAGFTVGDWIVQALSRERQGKDKEWLAMHDEHGKLMRRKGEITIRLERLRYEQRVAETREAVALDRRGLSARNWT
jgi:hypothetical protein